MADISARNYRLTRSLPSAIVAICKRLIDAPSSWAHPIAMLIFRWAEPPNG